MNEYYRAIHAVYMQQRALGEHPTTAYAIACWYINTQVHQAQGE